jgi:hypothetical protein
MFLYKQLRKVPVIHSHFLRIKCTEINELIAYHDKSYEYAFLVITVLLCTAEVLHNDA